MIKKYSPYKISNPSEGNVVPLLPNQDFILCLSTIESEIDYCSDFFELKSKEIIGERIFYRFSQKYDLTYWSFFSKVFLGEVLVCYEDFIGSLYVHLENSENIMTLINPNNSSIKVNSNSIIELIAYDNDDSNWQCSFLPASFGSVYKQIAYKKLYPYENDVISELPSVHRSSILNFTGPEHHFWFSCSVSNFPIGYHYAGKIILSGKNKQIVNINISSRENKVKMFSFPNTNIVLKKNSGILRKDVSFEKRVNSDLDDDCNFYVVNL